MGEQCTGGRGGIRTHGTLAGTPVFKTGALNHSATLPNQYFQVLSACSEQNKPRNWHPIGILAIQRRVDRRCRLAIALLEQMGIDAQGNIRLRVPRTLGYRCRVRRRREVGNRRPRRGWANKSRSVIGKMSGWCDEN